MVSYQTSAQKMNSIRFRSAKIEVGETVEDLIDIGLATSVEFTEEYEPITLKPIDRNCCRYQTYHDKFE